MTSKTLLNANIWKYYLFGFLLRFSIYLPYVIYYFQELGLNLAEIAILNAVMAITIFITEIPSGYFADKFGRKTSLILAVFLQILSLVALYIAQDMSLLIVSHILLGLSTSFLSGADSALLYDTLLSIKKHKDYKRIDGKQKFFEEIAVIVSSIIGALFIGLGVHTIILATIAIRLVLLFFTFSFVEPTKNKALIQGTVKSELKNLFRIFKKSLSNKKLRGLFIYTFFIFGASNTIFVFYQPYFRATHLPLEGYGIVFAIFSVVTAISALKAHTLEKKLGVFKSLLILPLFLVLSFIFSSIFFVWFGFLFFIFREFVRGFILPVTSDYTNQMTVSSERATVLSVGSMFSRFGYVVLSVIFGLFADIHGMQIVLFYSGIILLVLTLVIIFILKRPSTKNQLIS